MESKQTQDEIIRQIAEIKASVDSAKTYSTELDAIKEEIRSKRLAVSQISTNAVTKKTEIEALHLTITDLDKKSKALVANIETESLKIAEYSTKFELLRTKLDDGENGLEAVNTWVQQQKEEVGKLLGQSRLDQAAISEIKSNSAKDAEEIASHKKEVEGYRTEIEKVYGFINGQGLAHSFSERQKKLRFPLVLWSIMLFVATFLVTWALYEVFKELPIDPNSGKRIFEASSLFYRLSFVSPILLIFFVTLRQYSRERRLLESYAFKAATAKALESYTDILARRFPEDKFRHRILAFVLHAMVGIYRHPNNELSKVDDEKEWAESFGEMVEKVTKPVVEGIKDTISPIFPTINK